MTGTPANGTPVPDALAPPPGNPRFPLFDGLRAVAALSVVGFHVGLFTVYGDGSWLSYVLDRLNVGVTIFFLISGFLLYRPFVNARLRSSRAPSAREFARRRLLRIVPAYWLALSVLLIWPGLNGVTLGNWWLYYFFLHIYSLPHQLDGLSVSWTLCTEMSFYVFLPLYALAVGRLARGGLRRVVRIELAVLGVLTVGSLAFGYWATTSPAHLNLLLSLPANLDWFALGMALAVLSVAASDTTASRASELVRRRSGTCWVLAAATVLASAVWARYSALTRPLHVFYGVAALLLLLPAVFASDVRAWPQRILASRVAAWLGLVSYGIYLWHASVVLRLVDYAARLGIDRPTERFAVVLVPATLISVGLGALSYYGVERHVLRRKNRRS